ncbi:macrolide ABC transporter ATP-binding protein [Candidatus Heimdallarchaeota archaeon B3_Heim]|nr:MAG: macrolide ABC transporter ATP-binding protein [Candidatus Heimdallarchaeota archaeon B3_Heim]
MGEVKVSALSDLSLEIDVGKFVVLIGPSGTGKSTLLNLISAIDTPSKGRILIEGVDISFLTRKQRAQFRRHKIGFIFQFFNLLPTLTAVENVEFGLALVGVTNSSGSISYDSKDIHATALEWLEKVGLTHRVNHFPSQMSGGEQQRVAIARALAKDPPIIIADEPTGNLDYRTGVKILKLMKELNKQTQKTFIIATHNGQLAKIADYVISLQMGGVETYDQIPKEDLDNLIW